MIDKEAPKFNFLDLETTGLRFNRDKIIEINITQEVDGEVIRSFHSFVNPGRNPDAAILQLTGIELADLKSAPDFSEIADEVLEILGEGLIVAHNARFDYSFLKAAFTDMGVNWNANYCCSMKMMKFLYPRSKKHNLAALNKVMGRPEVTSHRAAEDTAVVRDFFHYARQEFGDEKLQAAMKYAIKKSAIPHKLLKFDFGKVPEQPGVYIFYGPDHYPLYVGMSNNLRRRVRDHLYSDISYIKDAMINQQIEDIELIPTAGVLGAALRESHLVKKLQPQFNAKLRRQGSLVRLKKVENENGYFTAVVDETSDFAKSEIENTIIIGRGSGSIKEFLEEIAKEKNLCSKLLGLEKGKGPCFAYQLGRCNGACVGKVDPVEYNYAFDEAFDSYKVSNWPFESAVTITEQFGDLEERMIFDKWVFLGSDLGKGENMNLNKFSFNFDSYKILASQLRNMSGLQISPFRDLNLETEKYLNFF